MNLNDVRIFYFKATLRAGIDLKEAVKLPAGESLNDWLAVHGEENCDICVCCLINGYVV